MVKESDNNEKKAPAQSILSCSTLQLSELTRKVVENGFDKSTEEDIATALDELIPPLLESMTSDDEADPSIVPMILSFLKTLGNWVNVGKRHLVQKLFAVLSSSINEEVDSVRRNLYIALVTKFVQTTHFNEHSKFGLVLLKHLLSVALENSGKPPTVADMKRIKDLKTFILKIDLLNPSLYDIQQAFMSAVVSMNFLKVREGVLILAYFLSKEVSLVKHIQAAIRDKLRGLSKNLAGAYGDVYFHAWILSENTPVNKEIEQRCIQDVMVRAMTCKRDGLNMGPIGTSLFAILHQLQKSRRLTKFSRVITNLYQPVIWRSLKSSNAIVRCNAAQIFFDVFPLEKVGEGATENCALKELQVNEMRDLLLDECHLVRIIAIKGLSRVFIHSSDILGIRDIRGFMSILTDQLAFDGSSYLVRASVFATFEALVSHSDTRNLCLPILKKMSICLHDVNKNVRKAFIKILLRLKEVGVAASSTIIDIKSIFYMLRDDDHVIGELLVKLTFDTVFYAGQTVDNIMSTLIGIQKLGALTNFFKYSDKQITVDQAYSMLITITASLNKWVKAKSAESAKDNEENAPQSSSGRPRRPKKRSKKSAALQNVTNNESSDADDRSDSTSSSEEPEPPVVSILDDHKIVSGLLNAAAVLWAVFNGKLVESGKSKTLNEISVLLIPPMLKYYKGTSVYYSVVSFASLVPIQKLTAHSTIASACISELKEMDEFSNPEIIKCLVMALCFWKRCDDIVTLAKDWLNAAFRHEDLNLTTLPKPAKRLKNVKVRFQPTKGKPIFGVKLLEIMFSHVACEQSLLDDKYDQLYELFVFLERVKELVVRRLNNGEEFSEPDLSDEFILRCLKIYLHMAIMLHRPDGPPKDLSFASEVSETSLRPVLADLISRDIISWSYSVVFPRLVGECEQFDFACDCQQAILRLATLSIKLNITDRDHSLLAALLVSRMNALDIQKSFVENSFEAIQALCEHALVYERKDEWGIMGQVIPNLLAACIRNVGSKDHVLNDTEQLLRDKKNFREIFFAPVTVYEKFYSAAHKLFYNVCDTYLSVCVQLVTLEIAKTGEVESYSKLDSHPLLVAIIMKHFLSKSNLASLILPWLQEKLSRNKEDALSVMSCISLLTTLVLGHKRQFTVDCIEKCAAKAYAIIKGFDESYEKVVSRGEEILLNICQESGCSPLIPT